MNYLSLTSIKIMYWNSKVRSWMFDYCVYRLNVKMHFLNHSQRTFKMLEKFFTGRAACKYTIHRILLAWIISYACFTSYNQSNLSHLSKFSSAPFIILLVDPPRTGLPVKAIRALRAISRISKLVYVSSDFR